MRVVDSLRWLIIGLRFWETLRVAGVTAPANSHMVGFDLIKSFPGWF